MCLKNKRKTLASISDSILLELEQLFSKNEYPDSYAEIAENTGVDKELVRRWFIQQRSKKTKLRRLQETQALAFSPAITNQSLASLSNSTLMPYFSSLSMCHQPTLQYHPMLPPYIPSPFMPSPPPFDPQHAYLPCYQNFYYDFPKAFSSPTCFSPKVELVNENKQDKVQNEVSPPVSQSPVETTSKISSEKAITKFDLCDIKENLTLSQLIDYFLGDFPSKCDTPQVLDEPNLKSKELEAAEFMTQLLMTRELSMKH